MKCYYHPEIEAIATCSNCGKAICQSDTIDVGGQLICQECLASKPLSAKPTNTLAILSLILGILSLCPGIFMGGVFISIPAWITGYLAKKQIAKAPEQEGLQYANIGMWIGIVITVVFTIFFVCYFSSFLGLALMSIIESSQKK